MEKLKQKTVADLKKLRITNVKALSFNQREAGGTVTGKIN